MPGAPPAMFESGWVPLTPSAEPGAAARESCTMTGLISGAAGGVCGLALGAILVPFSSTLQTEEFNNLPIRKQFRKGAPPGPPSPSWPSLHAPSTRRPQACRRWAAAAGLGART